MKNAKGFTLIELLIVVGIIGILAAAIIVAITPGERLQEAREATIASHQQAIGMAVHMAVLDEEYADVAALLDTEVNGGLANCDPEVAGSAEVDATCASDLGLPQAPVPPGGTTYTITADGDRVEVDCTGVVTGCTAVTF